MSNKEFRTDEVRVRGFLPPTLHNGFGLLSRGQEANPRLPCPCPRRLSCLPHSR
jgi:hypothetical protein